MNQPIRPRAPIPAAGRALTQHQSAALQQNQSRASIQGQAQPPQNQGHSQGRPSAPIGAQTQSRGIAPAARPGPTQPQVQRQPGGISGYDAVKAAHEREQAAEARRAQERADGWQPNRFYLPSPTKRGLTAQDLEANIIILDHAPEFAIHEHNFPDPRTGKMGRGSFTIQCIASDGHCPACDHDQSDPYFALFLSVIDMRPYTNRDNRVIPHSKKLMVIRNKNQGYFFRQFERRGTLRGMQLLMVRSDQKGASHGVPEFIDIHPEEAILDSFGHPEVKNQKGEVVREANSDCYAFDYPHIFPKPSYDELIQRFGGTPAAGGHHDQQQTWGNDAGQFNQTRSPSQGGGIHPGRGRIGAATSGSINRPADNAMQGYGNELGDAEDDGIPYQTGADDFPGDDQGAPFDGGHRAGGSSDPSDIPM